MFQILNEQKQDVQIEDIRCHSHGCDSLFQEGPSQECSTLNQLNAWTQ